MVKEFEIGAGDQDLGNRPVRETFKDLKSRPSFKLTVKRLDLQKFDLKDGRKGISLLDLTPNEILKSPSILEKVLIESNSEIQKLEKERIKRKKVTQPFLFSILRDLDQAINTAKNQKGQKLSPVQNLLKQKIGGDQFEILTKKSGVGKTKQYFFPANYYNKVTKAISTLSGEAKNIATVVYLGGFRRKDLAKFKIENLDLETGIIYKTKTKTGLVNGVLTPPMLDIVKKQIGDRKSGLVFNNMKAAEKTVNDTLKKFFPEKIKVQSPFKDSPSLESVTFQSLRHANEDLYNQEGIAGEDKHRKIVTLRALSDSFKGGASYGEAEVQSGVAKDMGSRMNAKLGGYDGRLSPADLLKTLGYADSDISEETRKIIVNQGDLTKTKYVNYLKQAHPGFFEKLPPGTGNNKVNKAIDISNVSPISPLASAEQTKKALALEAENIKTEKELIPQREELKKLKLEKERPIKVDQSKVDKTFKSNFEEFAAKNSLDTGTKENRRIAFKQFLNSLKKGVPSIVGGGVLGTLFTGLTYDSEAAQETGEGFVAQMIGATGANPPLQEDQVLDPEGSMQRKGADVEYGISKDIETERKQKEQAEQMQGVFPEGFGA